MDFPEICPEIQNNEKRPSPDPCCSNKRGALPGPVGQLGDKADLTPSPLIGSGSNRGCLTGETNDVVRSYGFALTEQASVTLLMPRRNHCSPSKPFE